jgi:hypothetical protein
MDPLAFDYENLHLRVDRGVFRVLLFFDVVRDPNAALAGPRAV